MSAITEDFVGDYQCRRCGYESRARVSATGGAANVGGESASDIAGVVASRTLLFVRCPNCGKRDPSATTYRIQVWLGALLAGGAGSLLGLVFMMRSQARRESNVGVIAVAMVVAGLLPAFVVWLRYRRAWIDVERRVLLFRPGRKPRPS